MLRRVINCPVILLLLLLNTQDLAQTAFDKVGGGENEQRGLTKWTKPAPVNHTLMRVETR